jgi:hypothetical protein
MSVEEATDLKIVAQTTSTGRNLDSLHRQSSQPVVDRSQGRSLAVIVVRNYQFGGAELAEQGSAAIFEGFDLHINPLAARTHGSGEYRSLLLDRAPKEPASHAPATGGDHRGKMQA